jgi:hypothetical protein
VQLALCVCPGGGSGGSGGSGKSAATREAFCALLCIAPDKAMGACCSRRSNRVAAQRQAARDSVSAEVHEQMGHNHRVIATTEHGSIVRLADGRQVCSPPLHPLPPLLPPPLLPPLLPL